jgi:peptidoglycan/LPS O-acetylase OafA/YrhL
MFQEFLGYGHFDNVYWSLSAELVFYVNVAWLFALGWHRQVHLFCAFWLLAANLWALTIGKVDTRDMFALFLVLDQAAFFALGIMLYEIRNKGLRVMSESIVVFALFTAFLVEGFTGLCVAVITLILAALGLLRYLRPLVTSATLWLGAIPFALYLVHCNLGFLALERPSTSGVALLHSSARTTAGAHTLAWLVTRLMEKPSIRNLRRWRSARQQLL